MPYFKVLVFVYYPNIQALDVAERPKWNDSSVELTEKGLAVSDPYLFIGLELAIPCGLAAG